MNIANPDEPDGRGYRALAFSGGVFYGHKVGTPPRRATIDKRRAAVKD